MFHRQIVQTIFVVLQEPHSPVVYQECKRSLWSGKGDERSSEHIRDKIKKLKWEDKKGKGQAGEDARRTLYLGLLRCYGQNSWTRTCNKTTSCHWYLCRLPQLFLLHQYHLKLWKKLKMSPPALSEPGSLNSSLGGTQSTAKAGFKVGQCYDCVRVTTAKTKIDERMLWTWGEENENGWAADGKRGTTVDREFQMQIIRMMMKVPSMHHFPPPTSQSNLGHSSSINQSSSSFALGQYVQSLQ